MLTVQWLLAKHLVLRELVCQEETTGGGEKKIREWKTVENSHSVRADKATAKFYPGILYVQCKIGPRIIVC